jgi:hypothetical protein
LAYIEVEGLKEFNRAVRAAKDRELDKRIGQANKAIGQLVIDRLFPNPDPRAIGAGRGANPRPSASKREVLLRVGGTHRSRNGASPEQTRMQPWGIKRVVPIGAPVPERPFIQGTAEQHMDEIGQAWLTAMTEALAPAFAEAE